MTLNNGIIPELASIYWAHVRSDLIISNSHNEDCTILSFLQDGETEVKISSGLLK